MKISIPTRKNAPETHLFVKVITKGNEPLTSRPVAFILPGGPGADHTSYEIYTNLIDVVDIVFHDPRGCGQSDCQDPCTYTMQNYIDDIEAIRQTLKLQKIIVIGKSYGSMCALGYVLRYPAVVEKLVLAAGAPSYRFIETAKENLAKWGSAEQIKICKKLWTGNFQSNEEFAEYFRIMAPLYSKKAKKQSDEFNLAAGTKHFSFQACNLGFSDFLKNFDYEPELYKISCPTLILAGEDDWINDARCARLMAEKIPGSQLRVFHNSGHSMESDVPEEYFQEIRDFLSK